MPVSASGGMDRYADFAPLGLPKIQHFCFLFAILSHKLISILQKEGFAKNPTLFLFICNSLSQVNQDIANNEGLPKIHYFCSLFAILSHKSISIFGKNKGLPKIQHFRFCNSTITVNQHIWRTNYGL